MPKNNRKPKREIGYFRVIITYSDGETSGNRVFKDRQKAERWAERQNRSLVVKKVSIESFVRKPYDRARVRGGSYIFKLGFGATAGSSTVDKSAH